MRTHITSTYIDSSTTTRRCSTLKRLKDRYQKFQLIVRKCYQLTRNLILRFYRRVYCRTIFPFVGKEKVPQTREGKSSCPKHSRNSHVSSSENKHNLNPLHNGREKRVRRCRQEVPWKRLREPTVTSKNPEASAVRGKNEIKRDRAVLCARPVDGHKEATSKSLP